MFEDLRARPIDPLLDIIRQFREDSRAAKLDLGVGVFQDESGRTPILNTVKKAEAHLLETQETKTYLGADGDREFAEAAAELVLGEGLARTTNRITLQAPGGTGALRLGAELIHLAKPDAQVWLGRPTWPNHEPIFKAAGLAIRDYRHFDVATQTLCFDELISAMESAKRGDVFVLHASCHNPTGADFSADQWQEMANLCSSLGLVPFLDFAYQGLGNGLDEDAAGARALIAQVPEALMATSCSKNFGLYRERTGALFVFAPSAERIDAIRSNLFGIARANYSMPPDHGAAIVRTILHDATLRAEWMREVADMQRQLRAVRTNLANMRINSLDLSALAEQNGMFATLPLTPAQIGRLKQEHAIYMVPSGRLNIAGLLATDLDSFGQALRDVLTDAAA
jgi:aromatic-amino-acid transaminase